MTAATLFAAPAAPLRDIQSEPFRKGAEAGRLMAPRCNSCGRAHWYPRGFCPFCYGEVEWRETNGQAELYSYSVTTTKDGTYVLALVRLDEGPLMLTNIVCDDISALSIGMRLVVRFEEASNGELLPVFSPAGRADA